MRSSSDTGFTLVELLIVVLLIAILAGIAAPFMIAAKASANEASAIGTMKALNSAQAAYASSCGSGRYAVTFAQLVAGRYASDEMDLTPRSGFSFGLDLTGPAGPDGCDGDPTTTGYYAWAEPIGASTGARSFATSQVGTVWQSTTGTAPPEPFTEGGTVSPLGR